MAFRVARWVVLTLVRHPLTWLAWWALGALWVAVQALSPLGVTTSDLEALPALREVAFLACLLGAMGTASVLQRGELWLVDLGSARRLEVELASHLTVCSLLLIPPLGLAWALGTPLSAFSATRFLAGVGLCALHLGALTCVLERCGFRLGTLVAAIPIAAWFVPGLAYALPAPWSGILAGLDAREVLEIPFRRSTSGPQRFLPGGPILGLAILALAIPPRPLHAVRRAR